MVTSDGQPTNHTVFRLVYKYEQETGSQMF
jgi:hypothetical protein